MRAMLVLVVLAACSGALAACSGASEGDDIPDARVAPDAPIGGSDASTQQATVVINEVFAAGDPAHPAGYLLDWVEVKNLGPGQVDLTDWHLSDDGAVLDKGTFPPGLILAGGARLLVNLQDGTPAFDFALKQDGTEPLLLSDPDLRVIDQTTFADGAAGTAPPDAPVSWARMPDGTGAFVTDDTPTPSASND